MHALSGANKVEELGTMNHGAELSHVGAMSASRCQRSTYLGAKICGPSSVTSASQSVAPRKGSKNDIKLL
jgi:hypothetical protein